MIGSNAVAACASLCLAVSAIAEESEPAGGPVLDEYTKKELAQRVALDALLKSETISVVALTKELGIRELEDYVSRGCRAWTMNEADVRQFFIRGATINAVELHYAYSKYPCLYRGSLLISNRAFDFSLYGGSYAFIFDTVNDVTYMLGCQETCTSLFPDELQWFDHHD